MTREFPTITISSSGMEGNLALQPIAMYRPAAKATATTANHRGGRQEKSDLRPHRGAYRPLTSRPSNRTLTELS